MLINTVTPSEFPRKPWANTLLYYDFENDSWTTVTNKGTWWSTMNWTATWVTFQTLSSWKKVAEITSSSRTYWIISNGTGTIPSNLTMVVWLKSSSNHNNRSWTFGWNGTNVDVWLLFNADGWRTNFMSYVNWWNFYGKNGTVTTDGTWHLLVATCGWNDGNKLYLDGTLLSMAYSQWSASSTIGTATTNVKVGMSNNSSQDRSFAGQIWCFGVENKIWLSDEITVYHNSTKWNYWL